MLKWVMQSGILVPGFLYLLHGSTGLSGRHRPTKMQRSPYITCAMLRAGDYRTRQLAVNPMHAGSRSRKADRRTKAP